MSQIVKAKFDCSGFISAMEKWSQQVKISMEDALKYQGGLLMVDLVSRTPPRTLPRLEKNIVRDVNEVFHQIPLDPFRGNKMGQGDMVWLASGPRWLLGVGREDYKPDVSMSDMDALYKNRRLFNKSSLSTNKSIPQGARGHQSVSRLNRIVVNPMALALFVAAKKLSGGKFKASWAVGWDFLKPSAKLPKWVGKHVTNGTAPGAFISELGHSWLGKLTFISHAPGCEDEKNFQKFRAALRHRAAAMKADMKNMARGAYNKSGFVKKWLATT